jgi:S1-C subfamily serine protease
MIRISNGLVCRIAALLIAFIALLSFSLINSSNLNAQEQGEDELLMDLQNGGAELFKEVAPSIVQIFNLDYVNWSGGAGSGYVIDKLGHAITNKHVVGESQIVEIAFFGDEDTGRRHKAIVVGCDPQLDLAVIRIEASPDMLHPIKLADSDTVRIGDVVATLGSPGGDAGNVDAGDRNFSSANWLDFFNFNIGVVDEIMDFGQSIFFYSISQNSLREQYGQYYGSGVQYLFHVSASINHGNSGGPCINAKGEVIGTNTWGRGGDGTENFGFSVPTNLLKRSVTDIIQYGKPRTPWCGIICHPSEMPYKWLALDAQIGLTNKYLLWFDPEPAMMQIQHVNPYSPAYEAGLKNGDIIKTVDNLSFKNVFNLYSYILNKRIDNEITFMVIRDGRELSPIKVKLAEKKVRYDSTAVDTYSMVGYSKPYRVSLTY